MKNPYFYTTVGVGEIEVANDIFNDSMPPETGLQSIGFGIKEFVINPILESKTNE